MSSAADVAAINAAGGARCSNCGDTAIACQHRFRAIDEYEGQPAGRWCCLACQLSGPRALHTVVDEGDE